MRNENLFSAFTDALYGGENLDLTQRYRANSVALVGMLLDDFNKVNLPENYFLNLGKKLMTFAPMLTHRGWQTALILGWGWLRYTMIKKARHELCRMG